jgi:hypothetical protein
MKGLDGKIYNANDRKTHSAIIDFSATMDGEKKGFTMRRKHMGNLMQMSCKVQPPNP